MGCVSVPMMRSQEVCGKKLLMAGLVISLNEVPELFLIKFNCLS